MSTFLDKSVILSPSICLLNGKCNLVITEMRFFPFYLINFVLVKMINIFSYNKGNFVATRSHRSWFILFEKIRSDHPNWYGELFRVCSRLNCLPIWYLLNCIKRILLLLIPNWASSSSPSSPRLLNTKSVAKSSPKITAMPPLCFANF